MITTILTILLALAPSQASPTQVSDAQKKEFIKLMQKLPFEGEFYTEKAIEQAGPYLPVLFALTEKDIKKYDIYPFVAISRGYCDQKKHRDYAVSHFAEISHPTLKLFWAAMLFDEEGAATSEIVRFLQEALESKQRAELLSQIVGPDFEDFKRRVIAYPVNK